MTDWPHMTYAYDGSFAGFLSCVWASFAACEYPCCFVPPSEDQVCLYPLRSVETNQRHAKKVYTALRTKISLAGRQLVEHSFLTCLAQRERHIYDYIHACVQEGPLVDLTDDRSLILTNAVRHLHGEVHLLKGFIRFSEHSNVLIGEISPKNRVLPLLRAHFCSRFPNEAFLLFDKTNQEALCHVGGLWKLVPLETLVLNEPDAQEDAYRSLWRTFYNTIAIESRLNPRLRMSHMPKRYWANMTEFQ